MRLTVDELVYKHKVVLDRFLVNLAKVGLADIDEAVAEFED